MHKLYCDLETYSEVPINHGTHAYAEKAEVLLWTYALDDGPVQCWDLTETRATPSDLACALRDKDTMSVWHNGGMFDSVVLHNVNYMHIPVERMYDTMVQALAHSLPGSLDALCEIFGIGSDQAKHKGGRELIQLFCKPPAKNLKRGRATRHTHPKEWEAFKAYAMADISAMRAVHKKMPTWNYAPGSSEMRLWHLDQTINMRGMQMDVDLAHAAITAVERAQVDLAQRTQDLTDGEVQRASQRDAMLRHLLAHYNVDLPDLQKSTLERRIDDPTLPWALRELLAIRLQTCTSSTAKYKTLIKGVSSDGRLRGTKQFCGANRTGRWAGRLFQPDNLPRPTLPQADIDFGIRALKAGCADLVTDNVMELTSNVIRGCIVAPPGKKLVIADLSNIEGRVLAWLAGEEWKLKAFADYDAGVGHDLYALAYAKSFGVTPEVVMHNKKHGDGSMRQVGKVMELALGYEGGVGAFVTFAAAYRIDLEAMAEQAFDTLPAHLVEKATDFYGWTIKNKKSTFGLSRKAFITCDTFKRAWREAHEATASLWFAVLKEAVVGAVRQPGVTFLCRRLRVRRDGNWLRIKLPSGRFLCYPSPQIDDSGAFSYMGINQYSRKWSRIKSYGGKLVENITQAVARDVLAANMPKVEQWRPIMGDWKNEDDGTTYQAPVAYEGLDADGYRIVLTVHDEVVTEAPNSPEYNAEHLSSLLATNPQWADGLPLAAAGFEALRYRKD